MRVKCASYFMPVLVIGVLAMILVPVSASLFSMPKFDLDAFSFGDRYDQPGTTTKIEKTISPLSDLSLSSGIGLPFGGFGLFRSPVTSQRSYTKTVMTPEGPRTQMVYQSYDGMTGERATTVTNS
ncbi:hypothetical protein [Methanocella arvoryzae]|uniref:Uncharacterized protein n=1 Tax=Methanocella arvoryzae (strain DSM 22066 / NBRC 105507 / MRE50) TaxID=351160 RepID=Q0W319_METAR|nr:hypothetical protein [Methanocella arvoryzae]CAJ37224.1 hypothetical protein RCIX2085 [Methanocella arvoryzae MRE50]